MTRSNSPWLARTRHESLELAMSRSNSPWLARTRLGSLVLALARSDSPWLAQTRLAPVGLASTRSDSPCPSRTRFAPLEVWWAWLSLSLRGLELARASTDSVAVNVNHRPHVGCSCLHAYTINSGCSTATILMLEIAQMFIKCDVYF